MRTKRVISALLAVILSFSLASCGKKENHQEEKVGYKIFASFYPVYVATYNIAKDAKNVSLHSLTGTEQVCMHNYMLTTEDIDKMRGTNLFIASGMGMESFVGKTSLGIPRLEVLDCGEDIKTVIEDADEKQNSHYWLNVDNAIEQAEKIKRTLIRLNPENALIYEENAKEYTEKLSLLRGEIESEVKLLPKGEIAIYHDSFEYFASEFGISFVTIPSSGDLMKGVARFKAKGFRKVLVQKDLLKDERFVQFCSLTGAEPIEIDTVCGEQHTKDVENAYFDAMRRNVAAIKQALSD